MMIGIFRIFDEHIARLGISLACLEHIRSSTPRLFSTGKFEIGVVLSAGREGKIIYRKPRIHNPIWVRSVLGISYHGLNNYSGSV